MIDNLSIAVHAFANRILISFSVDEMLLPRYVNLFTDFRQPPFSLEILRFVSVETIATCLQLQILQQGFGLGGDLLQFYCSRSFYNSFLSYVERYTP